MMKELIMENKKKIKEKLNNEKYKSISKPHLVIIQVGDNNNSYINNIKITCEDVGINCSIYKYKENISTEKLKNIISRLSLDASVTAISIQLPLPEHIDERTLIDEIDPIKDIDGVTCVQAGILQLGLTDHRLDPPIVKSILDLLPSTQGKNITIIGKNNPIEKVLVSILSEKNAIVTLCNFKAENKERYTQNSDIIILTTGLKNYFGVRYFYGNNKKIIIHTGDLNIKLLDDKLKRFQIHEISEDLIITNLLNNICIAYDSQFDNIWKYHQYLIRNEFTNKKED